MREEAEKWGADTCHVLRMSVENVFVGYDRGWARGKRGITHHVRVGSSPQSNSLVQAPGHGVVTQSRDSDYC